MDVEKKVEEKKLSSIINSIQIALDGYDDIFSDFDPSPFNQRILSDDFLKEMQKRYIETRKGDFEVRFSLPSDHRDPKVEALIKKRLKDHFSNQLKEIDAGVDKQRRNGAIRLAIGFSLLSLDLFSTISVPDMFLFKFIGVMIVPAGWFLMYSGLEYLFDYPQKFSDQRRFMRKFHEAIYLFVAEENLVKNIETTSDQKPLDVFFGDAPNNVSSPKRNDKK